MQAAVQLETTANDYGSIAYDPGVVAVPTRTVAMLYAPPEASRAGCAHRLPMHCQHAYPCEHDRVTSVGADVLPPHGTDAVLDPPPASCVLAACSACAGMHPRLRLWAG